MTVSPRHLAEMDSNDYWTHVGLVTFFFVTVVGPRLFSPGHTANSLTYIVGSIFVVAVATVLRRRSASEFTGEERL